MKKRVLIPAFLIGMALPLVIAQSQATPVKASFIGYSELSDYLIHGLEVNAQIADEGMVLLKNKDNFLPMDTSDEATAPKVSIVGKSSTSLVKGGGGSGEASVSSGVHYIDLQESLTTAGFKINPDLTAFYKDSSKSGSGRTNGNSNWKGLSEVTIGETPFSSYTDALKESMENEYNDAAIMVISREGSEGCDVKSCNAHDSIKTNNTFEVKSEKHALQLSDNEQDLFNYITEKFDNVIILINSGNIFQCDQFENNNAVKAVLWMGTVGDVGAGAVGRILSGEVNPSGRTVDTWARDFTLDPTFQNFSDNAQTNKVTGSDGKEYYYPSDSLINADGTPVKSEGTYVGNPRWENAENKVAEAGLNGVRPASFVAYEEGIYYDYRYYETRYADMAKVSKSEAKDWYEGEEGVIYPFGYGLSYTKFSQKIVSSNIKNQLIKSGNLKVEVSVEVKNTGKVEGKDVVQLYWKAPYKEGEIEKAYNVLCAFGKSKMLKPGESDIVKLEFNTQEMANYDFSDANNNEFKGYELDEGTYQLSLNKNAHEEYSHIEFRVAEGGIQYDKDLYTGYTVENRFTDNGFYSSLPSEDDFEFVQFSRSNMDETFPEHPTIASRTLGANSRVQEFFTHPFTLADIDSTETYEYMPKEAYVSKEKFQELGWTQASSKSSNKAIKFSDLYNLDYDDPTWDRFLNQLTYDEMIPFIDGGDQNPSIDGTGKNGYTSSDGPQKYKDGMSGKGVYWVCLPIAAATYNLDLLNEQGRCIGNEAQFTSNSYGWAGPAVNIHRSPFGGRNFEYYSADPLLSGRMAGRVVAGATDYGLYCFFKHFAVNDQEKHREGVSAWLTEQALREIYLKAFQYVIQEGNSTGIMSSYNRLGLMETAASYPLLTEVLRNEWGFKGHVISDMTHYGNGAFNNDYYENINNRVLAGCNQQLDSKDFTSEIDARWDSTKGCPVYNGVESYSWWYAVRQATKGVIYSAAKSAVADKNRLVDAGLQFSGLVHNRYVVAINESVNIEITIPDGKSGELSIDPFTPLPEGLTLEGNVISGSVANPVNRFVHVILTDEQGGKTASSFQLVVTALGSDAETTSYSKGCAGGCAGGIEASMIGIAALGILAIGAILIERKRKIAE